MSNNPGTIFVVINSIFTTFSLLTTALRFGIKAHRRQLKIEDWTILVAALLLVCQLALLAIAYHAGYGSHMIVLELDEIQQVLKSVYIAEFLLFLVLLFTKVSICLLVLRIKNTR